MTIASKIIAGCSPIADGSCNLQPTIATIEFFGNTSQVFKPFLLNPDAGIGDCITASAFHDTAIAPYTDTVAVACAFADVAYAYPLDSDTSAQPFQKCKEAA